MEEEKSKIGQDLKTQLDDAFKKALDKTVVEEKTKDLKSENDKDVKKTPYTVDDLRKLSEENKEKALEKIDEGKLDADLIEKYKALQGMATKRQQYIAQKEKELDERLKEVKTSIDQLRAYQKIIEDRLGDEAIIDEELDKALKEIKDKKGVLNKIDETIATKNWQEAEIRVREQFPDFGVFPDNEMTETLKENPRLLELAQVNNGEFGDIVLGATHLLTLLKEKNFNKIIEAELLNNLDKHKELVDKIIELKIEKLEKKNEKKQNFSQTIKHSSVVEEPKTSSKKDKVEYAETFKNEFMNLATNPELLQETLENIKNRR